MRITGMKRTKPYRHLREYAEQTGVQVSRDTGALALPTSRHCE
jgi:hypothetical protein